jgi:hypothetical protein
LTVEVSEMVGGDDRTDHVGATAHGEWRQRT